MLIRIGYDITYIFLASTDINVMLLVLGEKFVRIFNLLQLVDLLGFDDKRTSCEEFIPNSGAIHC